MIGRKLTAGKHVKRREIPDFICIFRMLKTHSMKTLLLAGLLTCLTAASAQPHVPGSYVPGQLLIQVDDASELTKMIHTYQVVDGVPTHLEVAKQLSLPVNIW